MKITIGLDTKSINRAKKQIEKVKKLYSEQMIPDLLKSCAKWLINRANERYLAVADIGDNVKTAIMGSWKIIEEDNTVTILNTSDKAVFVEFGVGIVGQESPHKNASKADYKYNMPSPAKDDNGTWHFYTNIEDLDLPRSALVDDYHIFRPETRKDGSVYRNRIYVETRGTQGVMYAYNALVDLRNYGVNEVWKEIKKKYLG